MSTIIGLVSTFRLPLHSASLFGLPRSFSPLQCPILNILASLLDFNMPSLRSNVQSTAPQLPFWTPICLLSTLTSKQPHSSYYNPATS